MFPNNPNNPNNPNTASNPNSPYGVNNGQALNPYTNESNYVPPTYNGVPQYGRNYAPNYGQQTGIYGHDNNQIPVGVQPLGQNQIIGGVFPSQNVEEPVHTKKKSHLALLIAIASVCCLVLGVFSVMVVKYMGELHKTDYAEAATVSADLLKTMQGDDYKTVDNSLLLLSGTTTNVDDLKKAKTAADELASKLKKQGSALASKDAVKRDVTANNYLSDLSSKYTAYKDDLTVLSTVINTTSSVMNDVASLAAASQSSAPLDTTALNNLATSANNIATKFGGVNTNKNEVNLAFKQAADAYQLSADAIRKRVSNDPGAADAQMQAKNSLAAFNSQWYEVVNAMHDDAVDLTKSIKTLNDYLSEKAK